MQLFTLQLPRLLTISDNECFKINSLGTSNVIDAEIKMGASKIIFASLETTYEICFADDEVEPEYLPLMNNVQLCQKIFMPFQK